MKGQLCLDDTADEMEEDAVSAPKLKVRHPRRKESVSSDGGTSLPV